MTAVEELTRFRVDQVDKVLVGRRIVEVGEDEILPDQNAEFVAEFVEDVGLINHRAADAQHVHVGVAREFQPWLISFARRGQGGDVGRCPDCAATEDAFAVDAKAEALPVLVAVDFDAAKPRAGDLRSSAVSDQMYVVQYGLAMRVRHPRPDVRDDEASSERAIVSAHQGRTHAKAFDL